MTHEPDLDLVFWPGPVRTKPFVEHVRAAQAGGFTSMAVGADTYRAAIGSGLSPQAVIGMAENAGVPIRHFEAFADWAPIDLAAGDGALKNKFDPAAGDAFAIAERLGVRTILAFPAFDVAQAPPVDVLTEGFAQLCDRAADAGMDVQLEFVPVFGVPNLSDAWTIVRQADRPNSGITMDTWHFFRGDFDLELLRSIPAGFLWSAQLADGAREPQGESLADDGLNYRAFAGEGDIPVVDVVRILAEAMLSAPTRTTGVLPRIFLPIAITP
jgi:sugar phosphate isomerase/epimerase